jgi:hypothetical protein
MIDNHPLEMKAMECFRKGENKKAFGLQDEFLALVKNSGQDHCSCKTACKYHGKCVDCVIMHRGHGDHLPHCLQAIKNINYDGSKR